MSSPAILETPSSGVASYDAARFSGGLPDVSRIVQTPGLSSLMQDRVEGTQICETLVPPVPAFVILTRLAPTTTITWKLAGRPYDDRIARATHILLPAGTDSWWRTTPSGQMGWFHLHLSPALLDDVTAETGYAFDKPFVGRDARLLQLVQIACSMAADEELQRLAWDSLGVLIGHCVGRLLAAVDPTRQGGNLAPWQAKRAIAYLEENFQRPITLEELAKTVQLSPFHFARGFTRTVGEPPHRFQQGLRVESALRLLEDHSLPIAEVAELVGFASPQAFARMFRQRVGVTPSAYRAARAV